MSKRPIDSKAMPKTLPSTAAPDATPTRKGEAALGSANDAMAPSVVIDGVPHLDAVEYLGIRDPCLALIHRWPVADHFFLFLGRSPTAPSTFMEALGPQFSGRLPGSAMRTPLLEQVRGDPTAREKLWSHFDQYLPPDELLAGRELVLIDYSITRESLFVTSALLRDYARDRGRDFVVAPVQLKAEGDPAADGWSPEEGAEDLPSISLGPHVDRWNQALLKDPRISTGAISSSDDTFETVPSSSFFAHALAAARYDAVSPHPKVHPAEDDTRQLPVNPSYADYAAAMTRRMKADRQLLAQLDVHVPGHRLR